jgi:aminoglycoside phosphotransferase (APT) family kinase protein
MPPAEHDVDATLVGALVADQHPDLLGPVAFFAEGWDTSLWRLGDELLVRLPRRAMAVAGVEAEQRWLPELAPVLPLRVPVPTRVGVGGRGYPWRWSIVPYLSGTPALAGPRLDGARAARTLGRFLRALHLPAPADAPHSEYRGVPIAARAATFDELAVEHADDGAIDVARRVWADARAAPPHRDAPTWVHGDLHPGNVLVDGGELVGVLDFNDLNAGDPATDVAACWLLFEPEDAAVALDAYGGVDEALRARSRGWVVLFALLYLSIGREGHAGFTEVGRAALRRMAQSRD